MRLFARYPARWANLVIVYFGQGLISFANCPANDFQLTLRSGARR
jgi:hypothetical protein